MSSITPGTLDAREMKPKLVQEGNLKYDNVSLNVETLPEYSEDWGSIKSISQVVETARIAFQHGWTMSVEYRKVQIKQIKKMIEENVEEIKNAIKADVGKADYEIILEIRLITNECRHMLDSLSSWAKPKKCNRNLMHIMSEFSVVRQSYGVVLIIGPWNLPLVLVVSPFIGAIAAGNTVVLKPSEISPATGKLLARLIPKYLDKRCYHVVLGGVEVVTELLEQRFDYIFYTGSQEVGKIIYKAATKNLVPVTLELGGKCPCYIDQTADMEATVQLLIASKWYNNGQTCLCMDYVICTREVQDKFIAVLEKALKNIFGSNPKESPEIGPVINDRHYQRVVKFLKDGTVVLGGQTDASARYIAPTVLINVNKNSDVMKEEIFGPILPIVNVKNEEEAIRYINDRDRPLVIYLYSQSKETHQRFISWTNSGTLIINDSNSFYACHVLPFGGVGNSGFGSYRGKHSFETFTYKRACLVSKSNLIMNYMTRYRNPPYRSQDIIFKFSWLIVREIHFERILFWLTLFITVLLVIIGYTTKTDTHNDNKDSDDNFGNLDELPETTSTLF